MKPKAQLTAEELEKAREARNQYHRKWAKENREKVREHQARYFLKLAAREGN